MSRLPRLYESAERTYRDYKGGRKAEPEEDVWLSAFCYVLAPVMLRYVLWVLANAMGDGKRRLYFLSRDGYMMYRAAEYFCGKWKLPLECRYLYCSRYALRSGEYCLLGEECLDYVCLGGMHVTLRRLLQRGGLESGEILRAADAMGLAKRLDQPLDYEQVKAMKPLLRENTYFMERMEVHAKKAYSRVTGYLRQEGLAQEIPYAVVDSGWTGSVQRSLQRLLGSMGCKVQVEGYYFGLYEYVEGVDRKRYHTWYFAPENGNVRKTFFSNNLFECVFSSPEGMAKGYRKDGERYVPVFAMGENPNRRYVEKGTGILLQCAKHYAGDAKTYGRRQSRGGRKLRSEKRFRFGRHVAAELLFSLMGMPSAEEAAVFGSYVFDDDVTGEETRALARALTEKELREGNVLRRLVLYAAGCGRPPLRSAWQEAGVVLAGAGSRFLWQTAFYKFLLYTGKSLVSRHGRAYVEKERQDGAGG